MVGIMVFYCIFQARACNTLAFRALARSATHRHRARRPAPWPRARTGARTATLPRRGGRGAGKRVPPPPSQRRRPAAVAQRPRAGSSPRRAARLRAAGGPANTAHGRAGGSTGARLGASTAPVDGVSNHRRAAATEAGAQARSPAGHRGRFEPRKSLRAVAARNSGRRGRAEGQAQSGSSDPCGRTVLLSHVTLFAFGVIATFPTLTRPQTPEDTNADCHL